MRSPVNEELPKYTADELWLHSEPLRTTVVWSICVHAATATENLNATRQHFSLLTQARLPTKLRQYLGTDVIYNRRGLVINDVQRLAWISFYFFL